MVCPADPSCAGRPSFAALMASVNERFPHAAYVGFAFWLAWSKVVWTAVAGCTPALLAEAGMAYGARVHIVSNVALLVVIAGAALFERRLGGLPERPATLVAGAALAACGTVGLLAGIGAGLPLAVLDVCCAVAGAGMGVLLVRCMLLLGVLAPQRILFVVASCVSFSAVLSALSVSLPTPVTVAVCVGSPPASAAFLGLTYFPDDKGRSARLSDRAQAMRPPRSFWQFVFTVVLIAFVAESVVYLNNYGADMRRASNRYADVAVMLVSAALIVYAAVFPKSYNYGKMYYPLVFVIMVLLGLLFVVPADAPVNLMVPLAAYQLFSMLIWCLSGCIVQQSRISPIAAFGFGYGAQMLGSVAGYLVGHQVSVALEAWGVNLLLFYLVMAMMVLALSMAVYPPRAMRDLLLSIPDEDFETPAPLDDQGLWERACDEVARAGALTQREREVMALLARGRGSTFISAHLGVVPATIYTHTRNIYRKLDVHSREELIQLVDDRVAEQAAR